MKVCPKNPEHKFFVAGAVICQDWLVDGDGNFIEVRDDCTEVFAKPQSEHVWECDECGANGVDAGSTVGATGIRPQGG